MVEQLQFEGVKPQVEIGQLRLLDRALYRAGINPKYIRLHRGSKTPAHRWKLRHTWMSLEEAVSARSQGFNIGVLALPGSALAVVDLDRPDSELARVVRGTFTVRTANGGLHSYFRNTLQLQNSWLYDGDAVQVGEFRTSWQYVVAPGCYVKPRENSRGDGVYRVCLPVNPVRTLTREQARRLGLYGRRPRKTRGGQLRLASWRPAAAMAGGVQR